MIQELPNEEWIAEETVGLQPHPNLKKFELEYYKGETRKCWGTAQDNWATNLQNLLSIKVWDCPRLKQLPLLSEMLHLRYLYLKELFALEYAEEKASGRGLGSPRSSESKFTFFPSLETLEVIDCKELKGWWKGDSSRRHCQPTFPRLSRLTIGRCSEFTSFPACPSLHSLYLKGNNKALRITTSDEGQLSSSSALSCYDGKSSSNQVSGEMDVGLFEVDHIAHLKLVASPFVTKLNICGDYEVERLSEAEEMFKSCSSLTSLEIWSCYELTSLCGGLEHLTALNSLTLIRCYVLTLKEGEHDDDNGMPWRALHSNLRSLTLYGLQRVEKLPMGMQYLTSLQRLEIEFCDNLKAIPDWIGCFQSLQSLTISACDALTSLPEGMVKLNPSNN